MVKHDTLLICSSVRENRKELRSVFSDAFHLLESGDVQQMTLLLQQNLSCIAAVLLDISVWDPQDARWLESHESKALLDKVPVIILSEKDSPEILNRAFGLGAADVISLGYDLGSYGADGEFGSATLAAVKAFQTANGLVVDGIAGEKTLKKLEELLKEDGDLPEENTEHELPAPSAPAGMVKVTGGSVWLWDGHPDMNGEKKLSVWRRST